MAERTGQRLDNYLLLRLLGKLVADGRAENKHGHFPAFMVYLFEIPFHINFGSCNRRCHMNTMKTKVAEGGRIVIPAEYRQALGLNVGDEVIVSLEGDELRIFTISQAIKRAQALVRRYIPEGRSLSDELLTERRMEN
jgi:AbrB family looped-hinge helix DNA binding protein